MYNLLGYLLFAFIASIAPGPNNILLFVTRQKFGLKKTIQVMAGVFCGFLCLLYLAGVYAIIIQHSTIALILKLISSVWLLYLAYLVQKIQMVDTSKNSNGRYLKRSQTY